jgi:hypothetical protein
LKAATFSPRARNALMIATVAVVLPTPLPVAAITTRGMLNDALTDAHPTMRSEPIASLTIGSHTRRFDFG